MKWRTDKPTANLIIAKLNNGNYSILERLSSGKYCIQDKSIGYDILHGEDMVFIYEEEIQKWADLKEDETVTDCKELEEEVKKYINDNWECEQSNENAPLYLYDFSDKDLLDAARHFTKWGAEHRDRFLNWIRDLIKKGIEKPEEALNILKRIDTLINDNSLWAEHLKK